MNELKRILDVYRDYNELDSWIKELINEFPNDQKLGEAVRELYNK
tara:strand:- start:448 stop:582 length:135 start_codon:yes stop_codon:yes gene_type:complete